MYERGEVFLMGDGNASISVDGVSVWNGSVEGHRGVNVILPAGMVFVEVVFEDESWSWNLVVKNRSVEVFAVEEWGEVIEYVKMTALELLMEMVKVHGVTMFFFVLACPLMFWIVRRSKEWEIVEAV
ncbi:MAG: hypothetical protein KAU99_01925 [Thermoplasmata archaeon]|nr:hypothetical protein [Thermoplasmata archaeon]